MRVAFTMRVDGLATDEVDSIPDRDHCASSMVQNVSALSPLMADVTCPIQLCAHRCTRFF